MFSIINNSIEETFSKIKFYARNISSDRSNHRHLFRSWLSTRMLLIILFQLLLLQIVTIIIGICIMHKIAIDVFYIYVILLVPNKCFTLILCHIMLFFV